MAIAIFRSAAGGNLQDVSIRLAHGRLLRPVRHPGHDLCVGDDESPAPPAPPALHARVVGRLRADRADVGRLHGRGRGKLRWRWWGRRRRILGRRWKLRWRRRQRGVVSITRHPRWVHRILSRDDLAAIVDAITRAESLTSAEVRVHLERRVKRAHAGGDPTLARARDIFARLEMHDTAHRASVLIYLAVEDRKLALLGDDAIHARVGDEYWIGVGHAVG